MARKLGGESVFAKPAYAATEHVSNIVYAGQNGFVVTSEMLTMLIVSILIVVVCYIGTRNMQRVPKGLQNVIETVIELLLDQIAGIMGSEAKARKYGPFLMTFFILILISNYVGLLPLAGMVPGFKPPTSNLSVTAGLAIIVVLSFFFYGIRDGGKSFAKFFFGPMLPLNLLDVFTRPLSLAVRLYGNIYGEEIVIAFLFALLPFFLPLPMYILSVLFCTIQAYVFMLLASVYIEEATSGGH